MSKKIMSPVDELFVKLPYAVLMDETLTAADKVVYASLRLWARIERGSYEIFTAIPTIAKACGLSDRQVQVSLHRLAGGPHPVIERRPRKRGKRNLSSITVLLRLSTTYAITDLKGYGGGADSAGGGAESAVEVDVSEVDGNDRAARVKSSPHAAHMAARSKESF